MADTQHTLGAMKAAEVLWEERRYVAYKLFSREKPTMILYFSNKMLK